MSKPNVILSLAYIKSFATELARLRNFLHESECMIWHSKGVLQNLVSLHDTLTIALIESENPNETEE